MASYRKDLDVQDLESAQNVPEFEIKKATEWLAKVSELFYELKTSYKFRENFLADIERLESEYQQKKYGYFEFKERMDAVVRGKTKREAIEDYDIYIDSVIGKINYFNDRIFYLFYNERAYAQLKENLKKIREREEREKLARKMAERRARELAAEKTVEWGFVKIPEKEKTDKERIEEQKKLQLKEIEEERIRAEQKRKSAFEIFKSVGRAIVTPIAIVFASAYALLSGKEGRKIAEAGRAVQTGIRRTKAPKKISISPVKLKKKKSIFAEKTELRRESVFSGILNIGLFKKLKKRLEEEQKFIGAEEAIPLTVELLPEERKEILEKTYLKKEAERIKKIIEKERVYSSYKPSTLAAIANISVKRISAELLDTFPVFFKNFYNNLRSANIRMLSNTYINLMVLFTIASFVISFIASTIVFYILYNPLYLTLVKGLGVGLIAAITSFLFFYLYPKLEVRSRTRSIKANMPFAVNHMAAVAASGSPPITIFKLIANTREYEEVSKEFERIVDYIEVFGFDLSTAIKSVAATTPSPQFKEMLEGLVSAIESGADIKTFLREKSEEAMNAYRLELQKYTETLATYSDIYTGVLIAAPLFFVITLTLVNLLGGSIGGFNITTVMLFGTYVLIPLLNVGFLMFLQASQPEI